MKFPTLAFKKPKHVGLVHSKQKQQKISSYKYVCFSRHTEEIKNLTQNVGKLESKLEEEKRQMAEDAMEKLIKVQTYVCVWLVICGVFFCFVLFFPRI